MRENKTKSSTKPKSTSKPRGKAVHGDLLNAQCPSRIILRHATSQWGVMVFLVLLKGRERFSAIRNTIGGVSEKMLAETLKHLEADGFVLRTVYPEKPPRVEYELTLLGREMGRRIASLGRWLEDNLGRTNWKEALAEKE